MTYILIIFVAIVLITLVSYLMGLNVKKEGESAAKSSIKKPNQLAEFNKKEQKDLRVYAFIRCLLEIMKADGAVHPGEAQFISQFSKEAQKKLSKPYDLSSKEGKFVWGNKYSSISTNRNNLISVIKTNTKKDLDNFFEKMIVMSIADRDLHNKETQYLSGLYADVYDVSQKEAMLMLETNLRRLKVIK